VGWIWGRAERGLGLDWLGPLCVGGTPGWGREGGVGRKGEVGWEPSGSQMGLALEEGGKVGLERMGEGSEGVSQRGAEVPRAGEVYSIYIKG